jgi:hypothetical protein
MGRRDIFQNRLEDRAIAPDLARAKSGQRIEKSLLNRFALGNLFVSGLTLLLKNSPAPR